MLRKPMLLPAAALLVVLLACGDANNTNNGKGPTFGTPPTTGTNNPPAPSTAPDTFLATMVQTVGHSPAPQGQITVNTSANNGAGTLTTSTGGLGSASTLQFCPFGGSFTNCMDVPPGGTSGNTTSFQFPQRGTFSGVFHVVAGGSEVMIGAMGGTSGVSFQSALLPAATITGGIGRTAGTLPLSRGSAQVNGTTVRVVLAGTAPSHSFNVAGCSVFAGAACVDLGTATTDVSGNVTADLSPAPSLLAGVIVVSDGAGAQFISGFRVQ